MFAFLMVVKEAKGSAIFAASTGNGQDYSSKIARDKAINVDPSVSMYNHYELGIKLLPIREPVHLKSHLIASLATAKIKERIQ